MPGGRSSIFPAAKSRWSKVTRDGSPIVLIHCFSCALDYWDGMRPALERSHRVVAVDLRGHGGSESPAPATPSPEQANLVAEALGELDVSDAEVVGHSLGGAVTVALAEAAPQLVNRVAIIDMPPDHTYGDLGFLASLAFQPVLGEALWTIKPDFSIRQGLGRLRARLRRARRLRRRRQQAHLHRLRRIAQRTPRTSSKKSRSTSGWGDRQAADGPNGRRGAGRQRPRAGTGPVRGGVPGAPRRTQSPAPDTPRTSRNPLLPPRLVLKFAN